MKQNAFDTIKRHLSEWPDRLYTNDIIEQVKHYREQDFYPALVLELIQYIDSASFKKRHCEIQRIDYAFGVHRFVSIESESYRLLKTALNELNTLSAMDIAKIIIVLQWRQLQESFERDQSGFMIKLCLFLFLLQRLPMAQSQNVELSSRQPHEKTGPDQNNYRIDIVAEQPVHITIPKLPIEWVARSELDRQPEYIPMVKVSQPGQHHFQSDQLEVIDTRRIPQMSSRTQAYLLETYINANAPIEKILSKCRIRAFTEPGKNLHNVISNAIFAGDISLLQQIIRRSKEILMQKQTTPVTMADIANALKLKNAHILLATAAAQLDILLYLFSMGLSPNAHFSKGYSAFHMAAAMGNQELVRLMRRYNASSTYTINTVYTEQQSLLAKYNDFSLYLSTRMSPESNHSYLAGYPIDFARSVAFNGNNLPKEFSDLFPEEPGLFQQYYDSMLATYIYSPFLFAVEASCKASLLITFAVYLHKKILSAQNNPGVANRTTRLRQSKPFDAAIQEIEKIFTPISRNKENTISSKLDEQFSHHPQEIKLNMNIELKTATVKYNKNKYPLTQEETLEALKEFLTGFKNPALGKRNNNFELRFQCPLPLSKTYVQEKRNKLIELFQKHCTAYQQAPKQQHIIITEPIAASSSASMTETQPVKLDFDRAGLETKVANLALHHAQNRNEFISTFEALNTACTNYNENNEIKTSTNKLNKSIKSLKQRLENYKKIDLMPVNNLFIQLLQIDSKDEEQLARLLDEFNQCYNDIEKNLGTKAEHFRTISESTQKLVELIHDKIPENNEPKVEEHQPSPETPVTEPQESIIEAEPALEAPSLPEAPVLEKPTPAASSSVSVSAPFTMFHQPNVNYVELVKPDDLIEKYCPSASSSKQRNNRKGKGKSQKQKPTNPFEKIYQLDIEDHFKHPALCGLVLNLLLKQLNKTKGQNDDARQKVIEMRHILRHHLTEISIEDLKNFYFLMKIKGLSTAIILSTIYNTQKYQDWLKDNGTQKLDQQEQRTALWLLLQQLSILRQALAVNDTLSIKPLLRCLSIQIGDFWKKQSVANRSLISQSTTIPIEDYFNNLIDIRNSSAHSPSIDLRDQLILKRPEINNIIECLENFLDEPCITGASMKSK